MAEAARIGNIIVPATTDTILGPLHVQTIKVVGGAAGATVNLRDAANNVIVKIVVPNNGSESLTFPCGLQLRSQSYNLQVAAGAADTYIYLV